jgi:hypothetical protein
VPVRATTESSCSGTWLLAPVTRFGGGKRTEGLIDSAHPQRGQSEEEVQNTPANRPRFATRYGPGYGPCDHGSSVEVGAGSGDQHVSVSALWARTEDRVVVASEEGPCVHIRVPESDDLPPGTAARVLKLRGECVLVVRDDLQPSAAATAVQDEACDHNARLSDERAVVHLRLVREDVRVTSGAADRMSITSLGRTAMSLHAARKGYFFSLGTSRRSGSPPRGTRPTRAAPGVRSQTRDRCGRLQRRSRDAGCYFPRDLFFCFFTFKLSIGAFAPVPRETGLGTRCFFDFPAMPILLDRGRVATDDPTLQAVGGCAVLCAGRASRQRSRVRKRGIGSEFCRGDAERECRERSSGSITRRFSHAVQQRPCARGFLVRGAGRRRRPGAARRFAAEGSVAPGMAGRPADGVPARAGESAEASSSAYVIGTRRTAPESSGS